MPEKSQINEYTDWCNSHQQVVFRDEKMKDALTGGLEYSIDLLQEAYRTQNTKLRVYERMGVC